MKMRRQSERWFVAVWALVLSGFLAVACAGAQARRAAVSPMAAAFDPIAASAVRGASEEGLGRVAEIVQGIRVALDRKDIVAMRELNWDVVQRAALADIRWRMVAGEISRGVAESLEERLRLFDLSWHEVTR